MARRRSLAAAICAATMGIASPAAASPEDTAVTARATALLAQMTVDEKVGQLNQMFLNLTKDPVDDGVRNGRYGSFLYAPDTGYINFLQHVARDKSRMRIPLLFGLDVLSGYRTIFPPPLALAASWDPVLVEKVAGVAAREARAAGIAWTFAPMVDIARDPRWGRIVESAGEDPYLGAAMAAAQVRGFQGPRIGTPGHVLATAKHFIGYGAAIGGRDYEEAELSDNQFWNVYVPPFRAAIEAGVGSVMSAYMDLNGVPATGNRWLLQSVLRDTLGFRGFVVSDAFAVRNLIAHGFARDEEDAARRALAAGVNMDMDGRVYPRQLPLLVAAHALDEAQIDALARPILEAKLRLGLFEHPYADESKLDAVLDDPEHRTLARIAAERSAVLLKNDGLLPLNAQNLKSIAVIGPLADSQQDTLGPWTTTAKRSETVTVLAGLRTRFPTARVDYAPGVQLKRLVPSLFDQFYALPETRSWSDEESVAAQAHAVELAAKADVVIAVLGEAFNMSGEQASRTSLALPGEQDKLLAALIATGKPVVVVLLNGRPLEIGTAVHGARAILEAWYPGTAGGTAVANLLLGDANPGGKLPVTWPRNVGQVPIYYAHNLTMDPGQAALRTWDVESTPQFPFGYGLSYAGFTYANLRVSAPEVTLGGPVDVAVDIENTSDRPGETVAQLYIHQRAGSASRPVRELKGFRRIALPPHGRQTVRFTLSPADLTFWSASLGRWVEEAEAFDVWVGGDSAAELHAEFTVTR